MDVNQKTAELEGRLQKLDRKFNFYFIGQDRVPPIKDFDLFKREVRLLTRERERSTSAGLRFYVETFLQKFISYRTKWDRGLRDIEDGRLSRNADFFKGKKFAREELASLNAPKTRTPVSPDVENDIRQATDKYSVLYKKYFHKVCNKKTLKNQLRAKMNSVQEKYGEGFHLDVSYDGKAIKIKTVKKN